MKLRIYDPRILAIDVRHRRFGFAIFEGPRQLLGWGKRIYRAVGDVEAAMAGQRLAALLALYAPSRLVVVRERWDSMLANPQMRLVGETIIREATRASIPIVSISQNDLQQSFRNVRCTTRQQIASSLARRFPELAWQLPPDRRTWQSEHPRMIIFDAIALGGAYWEHESECVFAPEEQDVDIG